jgi:hypothetical protein
MLALQSESSFHVHITSSPDEAISGWIPGVPISLYIIHPSPATCKHLQHANTCNMQTPATCKHLPSPATCKHLHSPLHRLRPHRDFKREASWLAAEQHASGPVQYQPHTPSLPMLKQQDHQLRQHQHQNYVKSKTTKKGSAREPLAHPTAVTKA